MFSTYVEKHIMGKMRKNTSERPEIKKVTMEESECSIRFSSRDLSIFHVD